MNYSRTKTIQAIGWFLIALGLMLISVTVMAAEIAFTYDQPVERVDGSALPPEEIKNYRLYNEGVLIGEPTGLTYSYIQNKYGNGCYTVSTVNIYDDEGPQSEQLCILVKPPLPKAPVGFRR